MYLVSQMWWLMLLAFLLGALLGYILWRACGVPRLQADFQRERKDMLARIGALEQERNRFSSVVVETEREASRLKALRDQSPKTT